MSELDPETKARIEAEERYRAETRARVEQESQPRPPPEPSMVQEFQARVTESKKPSGCFTWVVGGGIAVVVGFFALLFSISPGTRTVSSDSSGTSTQASEYTPGQQLAFIDGKSPSDAETIQAFNKLESKCPESASSLADIIVNLNNIVTKKGVQTSNLDIIRGMSTSLEGVQKGTMKCLEVATVLSLMMAPDK